MSAATSATSTTYAASSDAARLSEPQARRDEERRRRGRRAGAPRARAQRLTRSGGPVHTVRNDDGRRLRRAPRRRRARRPRPRGGVRPPPHGARRALVAAAIAIFVAGFAGFGIFGGRQDALARNGVHTTARVTATALYRGRFSRTASTSTSTSSSRTPAASPGTSGSTSARTRTTGSASSSKSSTTRRTRTGRCSPTARATSARSASRSSSARRPADRRGLRDPRDPPRPRRAALPRRPVADDDRETRMPALGTDEDGGRRPRRRRPRGGRDPVGDAKGLVAAPRAGGGGRPRPARAGRHARRRRPGPARGDRRPVPKVPRWLLGRAPRRGAARGRRRDRGRRRGLVACVALAVWAVHMEQRWQESDRIQAGPARARRRRLGRRRSRSHSQAATLALLATPRAGRRLVALRFPLGLAASVVPRQSTTVAYDPGPPGRAEIAAHPRGALAYFAAAVVAAVPSPRSSLVLVALLLCRRGRAGSPERRRLCRRSRSAWSASARSPRAPARSRSRRRRRGRARSARAAAALPAVLSAPAPASGRARHAGLAPRVAAAAWPARDRRARRHDLATLRAVETGPALAVDVARMNLGEGPNRATPPWRAPASLTDVRAAADPLAAPLPRRGGHDLGRGSPGWSSRSSSAAGRGSPWRIVYDTGFGPADGRPLPVEPGILDGKGYDVVPAATWLDPADAVPALARYWQSWLERGAAPTPPPSFSPGTWTTDYGEKIAGQQDQRGSNGLRSRVEYGDRAAPRSQVWTFGVDGSYELVCSPMHQTTIWTGPAHQDANRAKWGSDLPPGVLRRDHRGHPARAVHPDPRRARRPDRVRRRPHGHRDHRHPSRVRKRGEAARIANDARARDGRRPPQYRCRTSLGSGAAPAISRRSSRARGPRPLSSTPPG